MSSRKQAEQERAAKLALVRAEQRRKERRRDMLIFGTVALVIVGLIGTTAVMLSRESDRKAAIEAAADQPIDGVEEFADLGRDHVAEPVNYEQTPPVGGNHAGVWTNCGVYEDALVNEESVHSLEHGAVWITYTDAAPQDQVEALRTLAQRNPYVLLSPFDGQSTPIVASAWGVQLPLDDAADPRLEQFLAKYQQGEQTPEPGAPCTGGTGAPA
ncbi:DUF3105 domain-containing protein [Cellulomonas humilata]|uniref:DUF3105 domain-containing protein n=1 Tax=Cellulomonas humilata TaxID=144055 RepID=A0A7Y6DXF8_9CELL|nr:DUF3105 domain-containing protein [Cellulomonas humilata]